jgi:UDP-N-acetylglucosamine--N-acetylmuramyl-(pentapeptide) pyrophosphoryl-undecaprenol N-acetylglucosamine transferase
LNVANRLFTFFESMQYAYSACDLVISRVGATTIAELIYFKIPAIIIPYSYAYRHQMANAEILANAGSAIIIPDRELGTDILKEAIGDFLNHPDKINPMRSGYDSFPTLDTNRLLMGAALNL